MHEWIEDRSRKLREFFKITGDAELLLPEAVIPEVNHTVAEHLRRYNIEWHIIPSEAAVPFDAAYIARMYPMCGRDFAKSVGQKGSCQEALNIGHHRHQGLILGVETTRKPRYLPQNRQYYGSRYGLDSTFDPFADYLGRAGFTNGTRFNHNYQSLRDLIVLINEDWRNRSLMPQGFRLTICPPAIFNLIGKLFHPEWSETESLELGAYRDEQGNAKCYAIGCNEPHDFSFIRSIETNSDWTFLGFRIVLVPDFL
jgi:hypothetical protein